MAYHLDEKNKAQPAIVIDGFEKGIADSPIVGIGNIRNLNVDYYKGVAYVNYKRQQITIQGLFTFSFPFTGGEISGSLTSVWSLASGTYSITFSNGDVKNGVFTNGSATVVWTVSGGLSGPATVNITVSLNNSLGSPRYAVQSPGGIIYISDGNGTIIQQSVQNSPIFNVLTGCPGSPSSGLRFWNNYLFAWSTTSLNVCGDGTGDNGVTSANWNTPAGTSGVWPISNATVTLSGTPAMGDTGSETISSYTDAQGNSRAFWNGPTGSYLVTFLGVSGTFVANLTQGVNTLSWTPALPTAASSSAMSVVAVAPNVLHPSINLVNDGNLYFGNGSNLGMIQLLPFQIFRKENMNGQNFTFNSAALSLPYSETIGALTELQGQLMVGTRFRLYPWTPTSSRPEDPFPMPEEIKSMINILNSIYILAGNKGNIYRSNGYNPELFKKIPDNIAGVDDPTWTFGGIMSHRQKLWFQVLAQNGQTGNNILAGIFSLDVNTKVLNMEAQNSFGLASTTTLAGGILLDNTPLSYLGYDNYYSGWSNGLGGLGGVDFNDTTLWSSNEPLIETDLIPIGTAVEQKTFSSAEFKMDQPMRSGDSITLYARQSLSDTYVLVGTTTTNVLSDFYPDVNFQEWQWVQFKVTMSCNPTATLSSFNKLREIRIR